MSWKFGVVLFLTIGLSVSFTKIKYIKETLTYDGHITAIQHTEDSPETGALYMYDKINDTTVILGIFQYENGVYAAQKAKELLKSGYEMKMESRETETADDWKEFLIQQMATIETTLMNYYLNGEERKSSTRAIVAIVHKDFVAYANIGNSRILFFDSKTGQTSVTEDHSIHNPEEMQRIENANQIIQPNCKYTRMLGGYNIKHAYMNGMIGDAAFGIQRDVTFFIMGTSEVFGENVNNDKAIEVANKYLKNPSKAAKELIKVANPNKKDGLFGVIVTTFTAPIKQEKRRSGCFKFVI